MRRKILILLALMILSISISHANPNKTVKMLMDGKALDFNTVELVVGGKQVNTDVPAVIHDNRTLVPVHIIRNMGMSVEWEDATRQVSIKTEDQFLVMEIDSPIAIVNDKAKRLPSDVPPKIITYKESGRTMVPIAFLRELGLIVEWNGDARRVSIEKPPVKEEPPVDEEIPEEEEEVDKEAIVKNIIQDISPELMASKFQLRIKMGDDLDYREFQLTEPDRLVVDFKDTKFDFLDKGKLNANGTFSTSVNDLGIRSVRASQFESNPLVTRVTIELEEILPYDIYYDDQAKEMVVEFEDISGPGFSYRPFGQVFARLELRAEDVTEYDFSVSDYGKTLHIAVAKDYIELPISRIDINDDLLKFINFGENPRGDEYHIEIQLQDNVEYRSINTRESKDYIVEFNYKGSNNAPLIVIDPGHGGSAPGAISPINKLVEKNLTLDIGQRLNKLLTEGGFRTYMTRVGDTDVSLADRAGVANQLGADLFVSVHVNAVTNNSNINGIENLYYPSERDPKDYRDNKRLAQIFQNEMVRLLGAYSRGLVPRENIYILRETNMPAVLTEVGFLTNPDEASKLARAEYRQGIAEAIYQSIIRYFQTI